MRMTRGQIQDLVGKFAAESPRYRAALLANPKAILEKQLNTSFGDLTIKAVVDTADTVFVVVPYAPTDGELTDTDLEAVAGAMQDVQVECSVHVGGELNTLMQVNL